VQLRGNRFANVIWCSLVVCLVCSCRQQVCATVFWCGNVCGRGGGVCNVYGVNVSRQTCLASCRQQVCAIVFRCSNVCGKGWGRV